MAWVFIGESSFRGAAAPLLRLFRRLGGFPGDGIQRGQNTAATGTPDTNSQPVEMGENADAYPTYGAFFSGLLDDVRIYNYSLSAGDVLSLFQSGGCLHKSDNSPCDGCVSQPELTAFITRWHISNVDVTLKELMEAIGYWKKGGC